MRRLVCTSLFISGHLLAQTWTSVPGGFERIPGNAGVAMPARWAQGTMQVLFMEQSLPAGFIGKQLHGVRLRRANFLGETAWSARTVRTQLTLGNRDMTAHIGSLSRTLADNRKPTDVIVFAATTPYSIAATPAPTAADATGAPLLTLPFAAPFAVTGPRFFAEFVNTGATQDVSSVHWIEATYLPGERDDGYWFTVGNAGCGSASTLPMWLNVNDTRPPGFGRPTRLQLLNALPSSVGLLFYGLDPLTRQAPLNLGFGASLSSFGGTGCYLWTGFDLQTAVTQVGLAGQLEHTLQMPDVPVLYGRHLGVQAMVFDPAANTLGFGFSNGVVLVMNQSGFGVSGGTVMVPGTADVSPWSRQVGLAPVFHFDAR